MTFWGHWSWAGRYPLHKILITANMRKTCFSFASRILTVTKWSILTNMRRPNDSQRMLNGCPEFPRNARRIPKGCPKDAHMIPNVYPRIPKRCPKDAQGMPNVCPKEAQRRPKGCPKDTQRIPKGHPKDTQRIPKGYPKDTKMIPKGCPKDTQDALKRCPNLEFGQNWYQVSASLAFDKIPLAFQNVFVSSPSLGLQEQGKYLC